MTHRWPERSRRALLGATGLLLAAAGAAGAQQTRPAAGASAAPRTLTLEDAVRLGQETSEEIQIARAGVTRARGQWYQARSQYLPQLGATVAYTKTLKSQFEVLATGSTDTVTTPALPAVCAPRILVGATAEERATALAQAVTCESGGGIDFSKVGFGAKNQWVGGLQLQQNLYAGGRITAQFRAAQAGQRAADLSVVQRRAQIALDVTQAYYDAALADRLVAIADSTLNQTEVVLQQTVLARRVGNQSEFELLRAQVARDNQRPVLIQARSNQQVAYLRLKQLLEIPLSQPVTLATPIEDAAGAEIVRSVIAAARLTTRTIDPSAAADALADTSVSERAVVRQTGEAVRAQEQLLKVARSQYLPQLAIVSGFQRLYFPLNTFPSIADGTQNWTVGLQASMSLFNGGRVKGEELVARANLDEARAQLQQVQELAALDARVALNDLAQAEATWIASQGTVEQAQRAYRIDDIRYREGIATQTDLSQTRILLQQAAANRAVAARALAVSRMKLALLRDLPLQLGSTPTTVGGAAAQGSSVPGAGTGAAQPQQQAPQQQRSSTAVAGQSSAAQVGGAP